MGIKVGIVGTGQMGTGIAHVCAHSRHNVLIYDKAAGAAAQSLDRIEANLSRQAARQIIPADSVAEAMGRIQVADDMAALGDCDLVIEAVTEDEDAKLAVYEELCPLLKPDAFIATNTSSISVTRLASATDRPGKFIGVHFMNPVPMMDLVELIRGIATDQATYEFARDFAEGIDS